MQKTQQFDWAKRLVKAFWTRMERYGKVHIWRICLREIDPNGTSFPEPPDGFEFQVLDATGMQVLAASHPMVSNEFVENARAQGDTCLVVRNADQILGYTWRTRCSVEFMRGLQMRLTQPNTFYGFKTWIDPEARGKRLFQQMREYLDTLSLSEETRLGIAYIRLTNLASWASMQRDPLYRQVGWTVHASWGAASWTLSSPGASRWIAVDRRE